MCTKAVDSSGEDGGGQYCWKVGTRNDLQGLSSFTCVISCKYNKDVTNQIDFPPFFLLFLLAYSAVSHSQVSQWQCSLQLL